MEKTKQLTLYVDTRRCMGCRACETACKLENFRTTRPSFSLWIMVFKQAFTHSGSAQCWQ